MHPFYHDVIHAHSTYIYPYRPTHLSPHTTTTTFTSTSIMSSEGEARTAVNPSEVAPPTRVDEAPQQASTMPGDGSEVHTGRMAGGPNTNVVEVPGQKPSFKDQVLGYAKVTRGKALGDPETVEHGQRILDGDASLYKYPVEKK